MAQAQGVVSINWVNISVPYVSSTGQRAKFTFLSRRPPQVGQRTASTGFGLNSFVHKPPPTKLVNQDSALLVGLRPPDNGHGAILQKGADKCAIYLQTAVVADEALFLERIHKFTSPRAGGTHHLREGCLAHLQGDLRL